MELMLLGLGCCMGFDMVLILRRMRKEVTAYEIHLTGQRNDEPPSVYTEVSLEHVITGRGISKESVERALELAEGKYCSASAMFSKTAKLINTYRIEHFTTGLITHGGIRVEERGEKSINYVFNLFLILREKQNQLGRLRGQQDVGDSTRAGEPGDIDVDEPSWLCPFWWRMYLVRFCGFMGNGNRCYLEQHVHEAPPIVHGLCAREWAVYLGWGWEIALGE
jgi:uncharacterized OsmC-like protein